MGLIHEDKSYGLKIRESANDGSDFSNPEADYRILFVGEDGLFHLKDSAGAVTTPAQGAIADPMTTRGDIIVRNSSNVTARLAVGAASRVLKSDGTDPAWGQVTEAMQVLADNTTNNVSTSAHGYAPKGDGDTAKFLNANGAYGTPAGSASGNRNVTIMGASVPSAKSGAWTPTADSSAGIAMGSYGINTPAINEYQEWDILLESGTYSITILYLKNTSRAITTLTLDGGSSLGTFDGYNAGGSLTALSTITGIAVSTTAMHTFRFAQLSKNASSSNYYLVLHAFHLTRTGA